MQFPRDLNVGRDILRELVCVPSLKQIVDVTAICIAGGDFNAVHLRQRLQSESLRDLPAESLDGQVIHTIAVRRRVDEPG